MSKKSFKFNFVISTTLLLLGYFSFNVVPLIAQTTAPPIEYKLLEPLPLGEGLTVSPTANALTFIPGIFRLMIGLAGALAVVRLIWAGIKYMSTDAFSGKSEAKGIIEEALWGLLLAISAYVILYTINPNLVNINLDFPKIIIESNGGGGGGGGGGGTPVNSRALTHQEAFDKLKAANISINGAIKIDGIREIIVDEVIRLKALCPNCEVVVTSATGGAHASGACSHGTGYKMDLRSQREGKTVTDFITDKSRSGFEQLPNRGDGAKMYRSPTGGFYALESNHWDVSKCQ